MCRLLPSERTTVGSVGFAARSKKNCSLAPGGTGVPLLAVLEKLSKGYQDFQCFLELPRRWHVNDVEA